MYTYEDFIASEETPARQRLTEDFNSLRSLRAAAVEAHKRLSNALNTLDTFKNQDDKEKLAEKGRALFSSILQVRAARKPLVLAISNLLQAVAENCACPTGYEHYYKPWQQQALQVNVLVCEHLLKASLVTLEQLKLKLNLSASVKYRAALSLAQRSTVGRHQECLKWLESKDTVQDFLRQCLEAAELPLHLLNH